jgi:hypothetical protein
MNRALGAALLVAGIVLLILGFNASQSVGSDISNFFTGKPTNQTVWFLVLGAASAVAGIVLASVPRRGVA